MPTETVDFNGEEYAVGFDQFDGSVEHAPSPEDQRHEIFEQDSATPETVDAAEFAESIEPGRQAVMEQKGGEATSWNLEYRGDSGYSFDGEHARDPEGNVWTNEDVALHGEMLTQWKEGGNAAFFLPDYSEKTENGEILYVTMLMCGEDGRITYEIYSFEMEYQKAEEEDLLPFVEEAGIDTSATPWLETSELPSELSVPEPVTTLMPEAPAEAEFGITEVSSVPDTPVRTSHDNDERDASLTLMLEDIFKSDLLGSLDIPKPDATMSRFDSTDRVVREPIVDTPVPSTIEAVSSGAVVGMHPAQEDRSESGREIVTVPTVESQEAAETPTHELLVRVPPPVDHRQEPAFHAAPEAVRIDVDTDTAVEAPLVAAPESEATEVGPLLEIPVRNSHESDELPSTIEAVSSGAVVGMHPAQEDRSESGREIVTVPTVESQEAAETPTHELLVRVPPPVDHRQEPAFHAAPEAVRIDVDTDTAVEAPLVAAPESSEITDDRRESVDQSPMEQRYDVRERRTLPHGSEVLLRAFGTRVISPRPIDRVHESANPGILRKPHSKSPHRPPYLKTRSSGRVISKLDGIIMRRTA